LSFVDLTSLGLLTSSSDLADEAIESLQASIPGYEPSPGNLEVIQIEAIALLAAEVAAVAAQMPSAAFRAFGTQIVGAQYIQGAAAQGALTFTLSDALGHTIPAGTELTVAELAFFTVQDLVIGAGSSSGSVTIAAVEAGTLYNGASTPCELVTNIDWVSSLSLGGATLGGVDAEDDTAYQNRLVAELALQAPRPITASDYQKMALSFPPAPGTAQQEVGRATAVDGYNPASSSFTASTANGSPTLSAVSSFAGVSVGSALSGAGIPAQASVQAINQGAGTITMSAPASATAAGVSVTATGTYGNARAVAVFVTDQNGVALSAGSMAAIAAWLQSYREVNFIVSVLSPSYTTIYVTCAIHPYPGWDGSSVAAAVQQQIIGFLSPARWGQPPFGDQTTWLNSTVVRYLKLVGVIEQVPGVDYCASLELDTSPAPSASADIPLSGAAALPQASATSVPLPAVV